MKFGNALFLIAPLIYLIMILGFQMRNVYIDKQYTDSYILERQANYAADAAIEELLLRNPDINTDYVSDDVTIYPDVAVEEYASMLADNLGLLPTDANRDMVKRNYMKVIAVCVNNGYYIYTNQKQNDSSAYELISSPLMPYYGQFTNNGDGGKSYAGGVLNGRPIMQNEYGSCFLTRDTVYAVLAPNYEVKDCNPNRDHTTTEGERTMMSDIINNNVSDAMMKAINTIYGNNQSRTVTLPSGVLNISGAQPVDGPTVLSLVDLSTSGTTSAGITYGVGGSEIKKLDPIVAWTNTATNQKFWAYASDLAKHPSADGYNKDNATIYTTPFEAAKRGYNRSFAALGK